MRYIEMKDMASVGLFEPKKKLGRLKAELEQIKKQMAKDTDDRFDVGPNQLEELNQRKIEIKKELADLEQVSKLIASL